MLREGTRTSATASRAASHSGDTPELHFGLARAIGTNLTDVVSEIASALQDALFTTSCGRDENDIRLSRLLADVAFLKPQLEQTPEETRYRTHMDAGDLLRGSTERPDAVALLGVKRIRDLRKQPLASGLRGRAYVLRALMHPDEVRTLRRIYGSQFFLISVFSPQEERERALARKLAASDAEPEEVHRPAAIRLINRDAGILSRDDRQARLIAPRFRLDVRRTFEKADLFVSATDLDESRRAIRRFISLVFSHPFETPTRDEYGMAMAYATSSRSGALPRRVGACLVDDDGEVLATGTNEVPKFGGGTYWPEDSLDFRDFQLKEDPSDRIRQEILADVVRRLLEDPSWFDLGGNHPDRVLDDAEVDGAVDRVVSSSLLQNSRAAEVVEYGRVVHAEMAAITAAASRGTALRGATLYCTTFPCHECARLIVAVGVRRVVYVEPYPKSRVSELYADSIGLADRRTEIQNKVRFEPFIGVAPRRFSDLFSWVPRKRSDVDRNEPWLSGRIVEWSPATAEVRPSILDAEIHTSGARRRAIEITEGHFMDAFEQRLGEVQLLFETHRRGNARSRRASTRMAKKRNR